ADPELELALLAISFRRGMLPEVETPRVRWVRRRVPARAAHEIWQRLDCPPVEMLTGRLTLFHGTNFLAPPARAATVITVHDLTCTRYPEQCTPWTRRYASLVPDMARRAAAVLTPSAFVAEEVKDWLSLPDDRVVATPLGVDPSLFEVSPPAPRRLRELGVEGGYLLFAGTLEPRKNLSGLIAAYRLLPGLLGQAPPALVLTGAAGWGADPLEGQAHLPGPVVRTGFVSDAELAELYAGASCFCFPSLYEGFGLPPLEAMAAGTPVVASTGGSLPEILGDAALLVPATETEALAEAIARVLTDGALAARLRGAGRERARQFTWQACAKRTAEVYRQVA
ncbi:MAG: glycosyltransferase family 1 protein, partial [Actinomycetota bacterium]